MYNLINVGFLILQCVDGCLIHFCVDCIIVSFVRFEVVVKVVLVTVGEVTGW